MPNWVYNTMNVEGKKTELAKFIKQASQPYTKEVLDFVDNQVIRKPYVRNEVLSFYNFVKPDNPDWYADNWYDWNIENWGCKWDARDIVITDQSVTEIQYFFVTAWGQPKEFFEAVTAQFPKLMFDFSWEEEQGWGGEAVGSQGVYRLEKEWDIPNSHADWLKKDGHPQRCICFFDDYEPSKLYPDCPTYEAPVLSESDRKAEELRQAIIKKAGVSQDWADKHLSVTLVGFEK